MISSGTQQLGTIRLHTLNTIAYSLIIIDTLPLLSSHPDSIIHTRFTGQMQTLLRRSTTANDGLVAIEVLGDFLERRVARLDVKEIDDCELDAEPNAVEDVIFPGQGVEGDGIDVLVEENCDAN